MASIRQRNGRFQVQIRRNGLKPLSRTFHLKTDAMRWARQMEVGIDRGEALTPEASSLTLAAALDRYKAEISVSKKSAGLESGRIERLKREEFSNKPLGQITPADIAKFRDKRINDGVRTCQYDLVLLQHLFRIARDEWGVTLRENPVKRVRKPASPKPRNRRLVQDEYDRLREACARSRSTYLWPIIELAIETAMRRGELLSLKWQDINLDKCLAKLYDTKNGDDRSVPLTPRALRLLQQIPQTDERIFPVTSVAVRQAWDRLCRRAAIDDLHFHDLRHEAISRFFEKGLSVPEVALISGHRDYRMLFRYTHLRAEDVAKKLI